MTTYLAPTRDMQFVIRELAGLDKIAALPGFDEISPVTSRARGSCSRSVAISH